MTPKDMKKAMRLYKRYKTDSAEYRQLAEKYGLQTTELNRICWRHFHLVRTK